MHDERPVRFSHNFSRLCLSFCFRQMTLYGRFSHIIFRLQLRIKPLECQSLTSFQICSPFGAGPLCLGAKQRTRISRITFRFSQITFLYEPKRSENSVKSRSRAERNVTRKRYARKSACIAAKRLYCREKRSEERRVGKDNRACYSQR